jgi:hypothetical protein
MNAQLKGISSVQKPEDDIDEKWNRIKKDIKEVAENILW